MRTGVVDVSGEALTLYVFDHPPDGAARTILHRSVALNLDRRGDGMVLAPGLVDLAVETIRRFVIVARNAGCSFVHARLDDELATAANAEEIIAHVRDAVDRVPEASGVTAVSIIHLRPGAPATPSPV